jgi:hypothetical protein
MQPRDCGEIGEFVRRSRAAQQLGPTVDDLNVLDRVAALIMLDANANQDNKRLAASRAHNDATDATANRRS